MKPLNLSTKTLEQVPILRNQKLTYRQIGEKLNISKGTAHRIYKGTYHQQVTAQVQICPIHGIFHSGICTPDTEIKIVRKSTKPREKRKSWKNTPPPCPECGNKNYKITNYVKDDVVLTFASCCNRTFPLEGRTLTQYRY